MTATPVALHLVAPYDPADRRGPHRKRRAELDTEWQDDAACRGEDPAIFFIDRGAGRPGHQDAAAPAREFCWRCPVRDACLEYALVNNEAFGIWGGLTIKQRLALKRRRRYDAGHPNR